MKQIWNNLILKNKDLQLYENMILTQNLSDPDNNRTVID